MFFKVMTLVSLALVGYGELAPYSDHRESKQAVSSQSYHRGDVPLSYTFSQVHIYSTPNPVISSNQKLHHGKHYATPAEAKQYISIQYAPLLQPEEQRYQKGLNLKTPSPPDIHELEDIEKRVRKDHLEPKQLSTTKKPRMLPLPYDYKHFEFVPGHNIEVLQSVNREPAHNPVYRSHHNEMPGVNVKFKISRENKTSQYTYTQPTTTTSAPTTRSTTVQKTRNLMNKFEYILDRYYGKNNNGYSLRDFPKPEKVLPEITVMEIRPEERIPRKSDLDNNPYTRLRSLLLNVARMYKLALPPSHFRIPLYQRSSTPVAIRRLPLQTPQMLNIPGARHLPLPSPDSKTLLYPVQKHIYFSVN